MSTATTCASTAIEVGNGRVPPAYVYIRVEDVDATAARIEEAGGRALSPLEKRPWGERAAWFADPDSNVVAVARTAPP